MRQNWIGCAGAATLVAVSSLCGIAGAQEGALPAAMVEVAAPTGWLRMVEQRDGEVVQLQVAVREFVHPDPSRPRVTIAGAVHIGEAEFYEQLQEILDTKDVVLYEGVSSRAMEQGSDGAKVALTRSRMRIVASMIDGYQRERGEYPEDIAALLELWPDAAMAKRPRDAWGNLLIYLREDGDDPGYEIVSLGADSAGGGDGVAAEIRIRSGEARPAPKQQAVGLQKQMADALGLVFQLEAMDHDSPQWRNSDMTVEDIRERMKDSDEDMERLFGMLDGSSMMGRFSGMLLGMLGATEQSRGLLKAMMIEVLARADRLMEEMPGGGAMMAVIINERNEVVLADLEELIEREPEVATVGIIYGAGHLLHMEERLTTDFGYAAAGDQWLTAIEVDIVASGIPAAQLATMRRMIQRSLESQRERRPSRR